MCNRLGVSRETEDQSIGLLPKELYAPRSTSRSRVRGGGVAVTTAVRLTPAGWGETLAGRPLLDRHVGGGVPALVRRWRGIPPNIDQRSLDQHYLSVHLGGAKRLHREGEGRRLVCEAALAAHSVVPAGSAYLWRTEGPVDFMHVYLAPTTIERFVVNCFGGDPRNVVLQECLGESDGLIGSLGLALAEELASEDGAQQAYLDDLMHLLLFRILRRHSNATLAASRRLYALPPYKLKRALDFIESQIAEPIGVTEIAAAGGTSAFHFSRAFRHTMGRPPYAYLLERRIAKAKPLLATSMLPLSEIARQCGFGGVSQFSRMFKRATGLSPSEYRNCR